MQFPDDANGDVFRKMQEAGFDFSKPHHVEFLAIFQSEAEAELVANLYFADREAGDGILNIEIRPAGEGEVELLLVKNMLLTYEAVSDFERRLEERVSAAGGYLDGWGALQR